jgi:putative Mg2+ transporter-C (MgtC) family protein
MNHWFSQSLSTISHLPWELFLRMVVAGVLGGLIGLEREARGRAAGFRTHLLLAVGCCLVMLLSRAFAEDYTGDPNQTVIRIDPARLAYSVMGGIGFIGAGAVLRTGLIVRGLTTAASLWCVAAVGLASGSGEYALAVCATFIVLVSLMVLDRVSNHLQANIYKTIHVVIPDEPGRIASIRNTLEANGVRIMDVGFHRQRAEGKLSVCLAVRLHGRRHASKLDELFANLPEVESVRLE